MAIAAATVTFAEALTVGSLTDVAVMLATISAVGGVAGAVKVVATPLPVVIGETVPHGALEQDSVQVTPRLAVSLLTVAVTCAVAPDCTVAGSRETVMVIGGGGWTLSLLS